MDISDIGYTFHCNCPRCISKKFFLKIKKLERNRPKRSIIDVFYLTVLKSKKKKKRVSAKRGLKRGFSELKNCFWLSFGQLFEFKKCIRSTWWTAKKIRSFAQSCRSQPILKAFQVIIGWFSDLTRPFMGIFQNCFHAYKGQLP